MTIEYLVVSEGDDRPPRYPKVDDAYAALASRVGYYDLKGGHWVIYSGECRMGIAIQEPDDPEPTLIDVDFNRVLMAAKRTRAILVSNGPLDPPFGGIDYYRGLWHIGYCVVAHIDMTVGRPDWTGILDKLAVFDREGGHRGPTDLLLTRRLTQKTPVDDLRGFTNLQIRSVRTPYIEWLVPR